MSEENKIVYFVEVEQPSLLGAIFAPKVMRLIAIIRNKEDAEKFVSSIEDVNSAIANKTQIRPVWLDI